MADSVEHGVSQQVLRPAGSSHLIYSCKGRGSKTAYVEVTLNEQHAERLDAFEALLVKEAAVSQCYRVSPGPDFVLVIVVSDMPGYHALAQRLFTAQHHVRQVRVYFSIKRGKFETRVPMDLTSPSPQNLGFIAARQN